MPSKRIKLVAGETVELVFSAHSWATVGTLYVVDHSAFSFSSAGILSNGNFTFSVSSAETLTFPFGLLSYYVRQQSGDSSRVAYNEPGTLKVSPSPTVAFPATFASDALTEIETAIKSLSSRTNVSVNFQGQSFTIVDIEKLWNMRNKLKNEVENERRKAGIVTDSAPRTIKTRFV